MAGIGVRGYQTSDLEGFVLAACVGRLRGMKTKLTTLVAVLALSGCGDDGLADQEKVIVIYDNFQPSIEKIIENGLLAKDASTSGANITPITADGDIAGLMTIGGQVAQSSSNNENLKLWVQLDAYGDTELVVYQTDNASDDSKLQFTLQISSQPEDNVMNGSIVGDIAVSGEVEGTGTLALTFVSDLEDDDNNLSVICSHVTGTVSSGDATSNIDFVLPDEPGALSEAELAKCSAL